MKTIEWLKSQLEDGDILTQEVVEEWLASFWHKSELGQVAEGDARPVTGNAVAAYVATKLTVELIKPIVEGLLREMLPTLLGNYVTGDTLAEAVSGTVSEQWVRNLVADKADLTAVNTALADKASATDVYTKAEANELLADKADTTDLPDVSGFVSQTAMEAALAEKADTSQVYNRQQIDAVVAARPTQTEVAGEMSATVADLPNSTIIQQLTDKINALVIRTNKLSHVACGSETMDACLMDISQITGD
jgi:hypothetical protein